MNPRHSVTLANLGLARYNAGYLDGAIRAYELAVQLEPELTSAAIILSQVCGVNARQSAHHPLPPNLVISAWSTLPPVV